MTIDFIDSLIQSDYIKEYRILELPEEELKKREEEKEKQKKEEKEAIKEVEEVTTAKPTLKEEKSFVEFKQND
jgi:hypothetical protein